MKLPYHGVDVSLLGDGSRIRVRVVENGSGYMFTITHVHSSSNMITLRRHQCIDEELPFMFENCGMVCERNGDG